MLERHCDGCGYTQIHYASCRDRHCPKCQGRASARWSEREAATLLPVVYHHVVFTVPATLNGWVSLHPEAVYGQLFASAWSTLAAFAARRLDGRLGMTAVLHTWGEQLTRHVHLHCLVPGGALDADGGWHPVKGPYLFPVRALARRFRGNFVAGLRERAAAGALVGVTHPGEVDAVLDTLMASDWVVYSKPCLGHTETVLAYLARYTHRIALSDSRLVTIDGRRVGLRVRDHRRGGERKTLWLDGVELVRRYLLHVLPKGFMRVRHYGLLANRCRVACLAAARVAIAAVLEGPGESRDPGAAAGAGDNPDRVCPRCHRPTLRTSYRPAPARRDTG